MFRCSCFSINRLVLQLPLPCSHDSTHREQTCTRTHSCKDIPFLYSFSSFPCSPFPPWKTRATLPSLACCLRTGSRRNGISLRLRQNHSCSCRHCLLRPTRTRRDCIYCSWVRQILLAEAFCCSCLACWSWSRDDVSWRCFSLSHVSWFHQWQFGLEAQLEEKYRRQKRM